MYKAQITTGLIVSFATAVLLSIAWALRNWKKGFSRLLILGVIGISCGTALYVLGIHGKYFTPKENLNDLAQFTTDGEEYVHIRERTFKENGYYTDLNFAPNELKKAWNKKSEYHYDEKDQRGQNIYSTLKRYMTSKGLKKDRLGVESLSIRDVQNIY